MRNDVQRNNRLRSQHSTSGNRSGGGQPIGAPAPPTEDSWHIHVNSQTYGPYPLNEIRAFILEGRIRPQSQVHQLGGKGWMAASEDAVLKHLFPQTSNVPAPLPPAEPASAPVTAAPGATVVQVTNNISSDPVLLENAQSKSAGVALLLSFLIVGAGQIYNGQVGKGILMFGGAVLLWLVFLGWIVSIWSMIDAYSTAKSMNERYLRLLARGAI